MYSFYGFIAVFQEDFREERRGKHMYWLHHSELEPIKFMWQENAFGAILIGFLPLHALLHFLSCILGAFTSVLE